TKGTILRVVLASPITDVLCGESVSVSEGLSGSLWIPCVAVPEIRMTGRPAIIKRRRSIRTCEAKSGIKSGLETRSPGDISGASPCLVVWSFSASGLGPHPRHEAVVTQLRHLRPRQRVVLIGHHARIHLAEMRIGLGQIRVDLVGC